MEHLSPSEFYKNLRPEFFSDSTINSELRLPEEILRFEISNITKSNKENSFEILCRKMAEKLISPNLIPSVGPMGGGDGKTDTETYPVSKLISSKWYISINDFNENSKWAFAISAYGKWKVKLKRDIESILGTNRSYNRIYFITNQTPSSKDRQKAQDEYIKEYNIDIVILTGEWIVQEVYKNHLTELAAKCLNLSQQYQNSEKTIGIKDSLRIEKLKTLEEQIKSNDRYIGVDYQLTTDAIESAILSRMLELSKSEVIGKFDRANRFCKELNDPKLWIRLYFEKSKTYANWYDDYEGFFTSFSNLRLML